MISRQLGGRLIALVALPLIVLCAVTLLLSAGEQVDQAILQRLLLGAFVLCVVWSALIGADLLRAIRSAVATSESSVGARRSESSVQRVADRVDEPVQQEVTQTPVEEFDNQADAIEVLQRDEEDPDRLQQLFSLDRSVAKLRRAARGLATMTDPLATEHHPPTDATSNVALLDVVTSGLGSVEHFERVQIGPVADLICTSELGEDLSHLISELIDLSDSDVRSDRTIELAAGLSSNGDKLLIQVLDPEAAPAKQLAAANHIFLNPLEAIDDASQVGLAIASRLALRMQGSLIAERGRQDRTLTTAALDATLFPPRPGGQRPPLGPGPQNPTAPTGPDDPSPQQPTTPDALKDRASETPDDGLGLSQDDATDNPEPPKSVHDQRPELAPPSTLREALARPGDFENGIEELLKDDSEPTPLMLNEPDRCDPDESDLGEADPGESDPGESIEPVERSADEVRHRLTTYKQGLELGRNDGERPRSKKPGSDGESAAETIQPKYPKPQRGPRPTDPAQRAQLPDEEES